MTNIGRKNIYICQKCHRHIVTVDIDDGVTPFMLICRATKDCNGDMYSTFYNAPQNLPPDFEWFKPKSLKGYSPEMRDHIKRGGLDIRPAPSPSEIPPATQE